MVSFSVGGAQEVIQLPHSEIVNLPAGAYPNGTILGDIDNGQPFIISNGLPVLIEAFAVDNGMVKVNGLAVVPVVDDLITGSFDGDSEISYRRVTALDGVCGNMRTLKHRTPHSSQVATYGIRLKKADGTLLYSYEAKAATVNVPADVVKRFIKSAPDDYFEFAAGFFSGGGAGTGPFNLDYVFNVAASRVFVGDEDSGTFSANASFLMD